MELEMFKEGMKWETLAWNVDAIYSDAWSTQIDIYRENADSMFSANNVKITGPDGKFAKIAFLVYVFEPYVTSTAQEELINKYVTSQFIKGKEIPILFVSVGPSLFKIDATVAPLIKEICNTVGVAFKLTPSINGDVISLTTRQSIKDPAIGIDTKLQIHATDGKTISIEQFAAITNLLRPHLFNANIRTFMKNEKN